MIDGPSPSNHFISPSNVICDILPVNILVHVVMMGQIDHDTSNYASSASPTPSSFASISFMPMAKPVGRYVPVGQVDPLVVDMVTPLVVDMVTAVALVVADAVVLAAAHPAALVLFAVGLQWT